MKDVTAVTCDRAGCECLATIDMTIVAPSPICAQCGTPHQIARISIFLYLCEPHARECTAAPLEFIDEPTRELVREAFADQGLEDINFERAVWEFAPIPDEIARAVRLN